MADLKTFYKLSFINFNYNDGDYIIVKYIEDIVKILYDIDPILDSEPDYKDQPYSVILSPVVMTQQDYDKWRNEYWLNN